MLISKLLPTNFFRMELSKPLNLKSIKYSRLISSSFNFRTYLFLKNTRI